VNQVESQIRIIDESPMQCRVEDGWIFGVMPPLYVSVPLVTRISEESASAADPTLHKLDRGYYWGDEFDDVGRDGHSADGVAEWVKDRMKPLGICEPLSVLSLGVGQAYPELKFARELGVPMGNVTLLDKYFSERARDRIARLSPEATVLETGMYTYLQDPDDKRYSVVTTFGLHDVFRKTETVEEFFRLLPNVLMDSAIVHLQYSTSATLTGELARRHGFERAGGLFSFERPAQRRIKVK
jgi:hypothetical protein